MLISLISFTDSKGLAYVKFVTGSRAKRLAGVSGLDGRKNFIYRTLHSNMVGWLSPGVAREMSNYCE
jgi:hypothetical protein